MTIAVFLGSLLLAMAIGVPIAYSLLLCGAASCGIWTCSKRKSWHKT